MAKAYSHDLRIRVIKAAEGGASSRGAGRRFAVGESSAVKWVQRWRDTGSSEAKRPAKACRSPLEDHAAWLLALVAAEPDLTLEEIRARLATKGVSASVSSVWRFYDRHEISFKKNRACRRAGQGRRGGGARMLEGEAAIA